MLERVAITGMGIVSPLGCNIEKVWQRLIRGDSGVDFVKDATEGYRSRVAALVRGFNEDQLLSDQHLKKYDTFINFGVGAAEQAIEQSTALDYYEPQRRSVIAGSGIGGLNFFVKNISMTYD